MEEIQDALLKVIGARSMPRVFINSTPAVLVVILRRKLLQNKKNSDKNFSIILLQFYYKAIIVAQAKVEIKLKNNDYGGLF